MTAKRIRVGGTQSVPVMKAEPIGLNDLRFVQDVLAECAPEWTAELAGFCSEEATMVVVPENGDDKMGPSFVISRDSYGYRLDHVHWDKVAEIGLFASLPDVLTAICERLSMETMHMQARALH